MSQSLAFVFPGQGSQQLGMLSELAEQHPIIEQNTLAFLQFAENAIIVENALHESYFEEFGISEKAIIQPACHHYIHFLKSTAALENLEVAMAAILPCFWIYKKVGDYIYENQKSGLTVRTCNKATETTWNLQHQRRRLFSE